MSGLALRPVTAADDVALCSWVGSPEELERFAADSLRWPLDPGQLAGLRARRPDLTSWTAEVGGEPVGHVELVRTGPREGRLARVLLAPAWRGRGLGRALVAAAIERAREAGVRELGLNVFADNAAALATYRGLGFAPSGPSRHDRRQLTMRLAL